MHRVSIGLPVLYSYCEKYEEFYIIIIMLRSARTRLHLWHATTNEARI